MTNFMAEMARAIAATLLMFVMPLGFAPHAGAGGGVIVAQIDTEPRKLPEVNPALDNPNNPAVPGSDDTEPRSDGGSKAAPSPPLPPNATSEERPRCGTLADADARRRCLDELRHDTSRDR